MRDDPSLRSSVDDEGVGAELVGGDRQLARDRGPQGSRGARAQRSPWRGGTTGRGAVSETEPFTPLGMPRFRKDRGATSRGLGARVVPRGSVTRQKLSHASGGPRLERDRFRKEPFPKGKQPRERTDRVADPNGSGGSEKVPRARARPRTTVHAAWWSGPRPSGFDLRSQDRGPTSVDIALHRGRPRVTRHQRDADRSAAGVDNTLARSTGSPK